jgi:lysophospholipase L1-like esterase
MSRGSSRHTAWILAGIALAAGVGMATLLGDPRVRLGDQSRILLIGDSIAQGLTPHFDSLAKDAKLPFGASFEKGTRITQWTGERLLGALGASNPTLVIIALGTNDIYGKADPAKLFAATAELLAVLEQQTRPDCYGLGPDVLWIGPHLPAFPDPQLGAAIRDAVSGYHAGCDGAAEYFDSSGLDVRLGPDGVHPTAAGYAAWAGSVWKRIS